MTAAQFRKLALSYPATEEASHVSHPDFRVQGKIFATLGYPDDRHGALMLPPEKQKELVRDFPESFLPAPGAWGRRGNTIVLLVQAEAKVVGEAMTLAWKQRASKNLQAQWDEELRA